MAVQTKVVRFLMAGAVAIALSGCVTVPDAIKGTSPTPQQDLVRVMNAPELYVGQEARFGGKVVVIGVGKKNLDFNFTLLQKKELNVFGSRNALKKDFVELIDLVKGGKTPIENIITNVYKFEDGAKAFYDFAHNPGDMLKVVIDFTGN